MTKGTKRASPGAEDEKENPLIGFELSDEQRSSLQAVAKEVARAELVLERHAQLKLVPVYQKRREVLKTIPKFWGIALMHHTLVSIHAQHSQDQIALSYLEDLWVHRDPTETRSFTIEFYFKENPYFSDTVLKKEFKYVPTGAAADEKPDEDGITESMLDFSWERDIVPSVTKIQWKDDSKNLTKLHPRSEVEEDDIPADSGSFFNFFEQKDDPFEVGVTIANELFAEATDYFFGINENDFLDSDDEESDDEEEDEEIDLEKPRTKKQKV